MDYYGYSVCASNTWLYGKGYQWTLTHYSSTAFGYLAFVILSGGALYYTSVNNGYSE